MSEGSADQNHLVYRFMFVSILNMGMVTVFWGVTATLLTAVILHSQAPFSIASHLDSKRTWLAIAVSAAFGYFFLRRRFEFYARSMRVAAGTITVHRIGDMFMHSNVGEKAERPGMR